MITCGIQIHHGPSLCLIKDGEVVWYQEERKLANRKQISFIPYRCIDLLFSGEPINVDQFVVSGYNFYESELGQIEAYLKYKNIVTPSSKIDSFFTKKTYGFFAPHHLAHALKSYIDSGFKRARIFVVDSRGSDWYLSDKTETFETCSVYHADETGIKCIFKKVWSKEIKPKDVTIDFNYNPFLNKPWVPVYTPLAVDENTQVDISHKLDLGRFYSKISSHFNFNEEEGKFMGYQSYGKLDEKIYHLFKEGVTEEDVKKLPITHDVAHTAQTYFEDRYADLVEHFEYDNMVFSGGTALNVCNNYKLTKKFKNSNLWFDPLCSDTGNSIGMAYAYLYYSKHELKPLKNIYIAHTPDYKLSLQSTEKITTVKLKDIIQLLEKGEVVALFQGKSEAGPRALGNRSLLLDPTIPNGKDIMNTIKKREGFRPFACSILEEKCDKWFEMAGIKKSPYMMYAFDAKPMAIEKTPAIIHVDNTCRVQTVSEDENKVLYNILKDFKVPLIMNTSMNLAGDAINETLEDALRTMRNSPLKYIYVADQNKLIEKIK